LDGGIYGTITGKLRNDEPKVSGRLLAAVSVILRGKENPEVLLIKRAERDGDPWSGQVAFPGGRMREGERTAREVAIRETLEEVGVDLSEASEFLGYFDPFVTHTGTMNVVPSVYLLKREVEVRPNRREVSSFIWTNLAKLLGPELRSTHKVGIQGQQVEMPAFVIGDYVVWGLTYRIVTTLMGIPES
jgi:8-oxo-dGTP pyrophosphatase MutT (NUDIX family)